MWFRSLYIALFFLSGIYSFSQPNKQATGDEHYEHNNFLMAIPLFKDELKDAPNDKALKLKLGICYLKTRINRQEAVKYLEAYTKEDKNEDEGWFNLGRAYMLNNQIDNAIAAFEKTKALKSKREEEVNHYIEQCNNAKKFMASPVNVTFQNLGKEINSEDPDYYPFVTADETFLAFTSRRKDGVGGKKVEVDGYHPSDIFFSKVQNGSWTAATNAGRAINTPLDEQVVGLKSNGLEMYVYLDHIEKFGDLYIASRIDVAAEFPKPKICVSQINEKIETSGCLSEDGNTLFFARREKMDANSDLYVCRKLPNGKWAIPQKLPDEINTKYNEDFPYLSNDGVTLYFSSEGHNSMGGYDLFKTIWDKENNTFSKPENLGFPVNTTDDDRNICVTPDNRVAYISAFRPGGLGDLDIYRIKFNDIEQISKIYTGKVFFGDSVSTDQPKGLNALITVINKKTKKELLFTPHSKTSKFVMNLPVGKYKIVVTADGYTEYTEELSVSDIGKIDLQKNKNFLLRKR